MSSSENAGLIVRLAAPGDYNEIDRLTYNGYLTSQRACSPANDQQALQSEMKRSSSYICTLKGSAGMRAQDALTFVCVKPVTKSTSFLGSFFSRTRRGSSSNEEVQPEVLEALKALETRDRTSSSDHQNHRRSSICEAPQAKRVHSPMEDDAASSSKSTRASEASVYGKTQSPVVSEPAASEPRWNKLMHPLRRKKETAPTRPNSGAQELQFIENLKDKVACLMAAEVGRDSLDHYRACETLTGNEDQFEINKNIRTRVKRQEGTLLPPPETGLLCEPNGKSKYIKPEHIELEGYIDADGSYVSRPSPLLNGSSLFPKEDHFERPLMDPDRTQAPAARHRFGVFHRNRRDSVTGANISEQSSPASLQSGVARDSSSVKAAEKILGTVTYAPYESGWCIVSDLNDVELRMLSVTAVKGVAGLLIDHCLTVARAERRTMVHVLVNAANVAAHILYLKHGFHRNPAKDRLDAHAETSLKCFSIDLGNPRPIAEEQAEAPGNVAAYSADDKDPLEGLFGLHTLKHLSSKKDNRRPGLLFTLKTVRNERALAYQTLKSGESGRQKVCPKGYYPKTELRSGL